MNNTFDEKYLTKLINAKDYTSLIEYLNTINDELVIQKIIVILKKKLVFIDKRGIGAFTDHLNLIVSELKSLNNYINEVNIINRIYKEESLLQSRIRSIPRPLRLSYIFNALNQICLLNKKALLHGGIKNFSEVDKFINYDMFCDMYCSSFKSLIYDKEINDGNKFIYDCYIPYYKKKYLDVADQYINDSIITYQWIPVIENWRHGLIKFIDNKAYIKAEYIKNENLTWLNYTAGKIHIYQKIHQCEIALISSHHSNNKGKFPFNYPTAHSTDVYLQDTYHNFNKDIVIKDIPLNHWIQCYQTLINYSKKISIVAGLINNKLFHYLIYKLTTIKSKKNWIRMFIKAGVPKQDATTIFSYMIFSRKSSDIFDFPFIPIKDKFLLPHMIVESADTGLVLKSRLKQPDIAYSDNGKTFENYTLDILKYRNIPSINLHHKISGKEYECDIAFVLDNVLFLCELKDTGSPQLLDGNYNFYLSDIDQAKRITSHFETNKQYVMESFEKSGYHVNFNKTIKFLIYNTNFHRSLKVDDIHVIDYESFIAPIRRGNLDLRICSIYGGPLDCLTGNISAKKILKHIKSPYFVCDYDKVWKTREREFNIGNIKIKAELVGTNPIKMEELEAIISPEAEMRYNIKFKHRPAK